VIPREVTGGVPTTPGRLEPVTRASIRSLSGAAPLIRYRTAEWGSASEIHFLPGTRSGIDEGA
jgi:hypothetical protein